MSATVARPQSSESSHFYEANTGIPVYEVPRADGKGMRKTNVADARKLGLVPSTTTILKLLRAYALENWKVEQAILAVLTSPQQSGEALDAFVERIIKSERVHDAEASMSRDRGKDIHRAIEDLFQGKPISPEIDPWVRPAFEEVARMGELVCTEKTLANAEFGGMLDLVQLRQELRLHNIYTLTDWKTSKKLPTKGAWDEHVLQLGAYAKLWADRFSEQDHVEIKTQNVYISTVEQGKFVICPHEQDWYETYAHGFAPLVEHWRWANGFV